MNVSFEIMDLWQQHSIAVFPEGYGGKTINGTDLSLLDAEIAGCVHMYVNNGVIDARHAKILSERLVDLNAIILLLDSEELIYYNRLREMANLVLQESEQ